MVDGRNHIMDYRESEDELGDFLEAMTVEDLDGAVPKSALYAAYCAFETGPVRLSKNLFGRLMAERFQEKRTAGARAYTGIRLSAEGEVAIRRPMSGGGSWNE